MKKQPSTPALDFEIAMFREHFASLAEAPACQGCGQELSFDSDTTLLGIKPKEGRIELTLNCLQCLKAGNRREVGVSTSFDAPHLAPVLDQMPALDIVPWLGRQVQRMG